MLYLMITGVVGFAEGYSQTEARWFDNAAAAKAAYDMAVDGWREVTVCDRFQSNNLTQCTFKVPFRAVTMGIDVHHFRHPGQSGRRHVLGCLGSIPEKVEGVCCSYVVLVECPVSLVHDTMQEPPRSCLGFGGIDRCS